MFWQQFVLTFALLKMLTGVDKEQEFALRFWKGSSTEQLSPFLPKRLNPALQEFSCARKDPSSSVPSFIVYDQPSQVYFPRLKNTDPEINTEPILENDEDIAAVKSMFQTLADSVNSTQGQWQTIVLDHAGKEIYGDIIGVVEVEEWRNGKKLIPTSWLM